MNQQRLLQLVQNNRQKVSGQDTKELQTKRMKFLDWVSSWNYNPRPQTFEMYEDCEATAEVISDGN